MWRPEHALGQIADIHQINIDVHRAKTRPVHWQTSTSSHHRVGNRFQHCHESDNGTDRSKSSNTRKLATHLVALLSTMNFALVEIVTEIDPLFHCRLPHERSQCSNIAPCFVEGRRHVFLATLHSAIVVT